MTHTSDFHAFENGSDAARDNKEVCLAVVSECGSALQFASERMREDRDVCMAAVTENGNALEYVSPRLKFDHDTCLAAVSTNGEALELAPLHFRDDHAICLAAVSSNSYVLEIVSDRLKDNRDVCMAAVLGDVSVWTFVSPKLKRDFRRSLPGVFEKFLVRCGIFNRKLPRDTRAIEGFGGKFYSKITQKVVTVHNRASTVLFRLCMKNCKKSVYGFPDEVQDMVLSQVGSLDPDFIERKDSDRIGEKRRRNFMDKGFRGERFSIVALNE